MKRHFQDYNGHPIMVLEVTNYLGHYYVLKMVNETIYHDLGRAFAAGRQAILQALRRKRRETSQD